MCHCTGQNSYMGHSSPSSLWTIDGGAGTGTAVHQGHAGLHSTTASWRDNSAGGWTLWIFWLLWIMSGSNIGWTWSSTIVWHNMQIQRMSCPWGGSPESALLGVAWSFFSEKWCIFPQGCQTLDPHLSTVNMDIVFGCLVQDFLTRRVLSQDKMEDSYRSVKQRVSVVTSDNEALYSKLASVPSYGFTLQWYSHKELHCFIVGRCEGDIILLSQVTVIFAARDCISLCCIVWAQQASIKIYSVKSQTPFYAVVCNPPTTMLPLHTHFLITCLSRFNSRLRPTGSRVLTSTLPM